MVDIWLPTSTTRRERRRPFPWVIVIHGDFWTATPDRRYMYPMAAALAAQGFPTALIEYRGVGHPGGGWPGTLDDVARACRMLPDLAARTRESGRDRPDVDRPEGDRPVLIGHGAGGHLALWAARRAPVRAVLALAPIADLVAAHRAGIGDGAVAALLGGGPEQVPDRYAAADPAVALPMGMPVTIMHGSADTRIPVTVSEDFLAAARRAGDMAVLRELPGADHFSLVDPDSAAWPSVLAALTALS